jgi:response regulator RpfG family c-di-GMP phosphodiesterase
VDDEKRVLNSMRAMFRREYELYLTTRGDEALKIISEQPIDVLVADQRMPLMTGVEVLTEAKKCSPGTVRILLTGYSDLDAIEGAMNEGEVFRFLNKPCAAEELRGTILEAAQIARDTADQVRGEGAAESAVSEDDVAELSSGSAVPFELPKREPSLPERALMMRRRALKAAPKIAPVKTPPVPESEPAASQTQPSIPRPDLPPPTPQHDASSKPKPSTPSASPEFAEEEGSTTLEIVMAGDTVTVVDPSEAATQTPEPQAKAPTAPPAPAPAGPAKPAQGATSEAAVPPAAVPGNRIQCVGRGKYNISVMVFSPDDHFARSIGRALDGTFYTFHATNAVRLIEAIGKIAPAVLITDVTTDPDVIKNLTSMLKKRLPALVTMVAGKHRDAEIMIGLINHGQVFRFVDKPLSSTSCHKHVRDALKRHIVLRRNPELAKRYSVRGSGLTPTTSLGARIVKGLNRVRRLWGQDD